tara:strand:+ start:143 stop:364 length:222 start_codon:yes stop_codon:yes gene_type:complete
MYRCGNKPEIGDAISIEVNIDVSEMKVSTGTVALVLETDATWGGKKNPLLTVKFGDDDIQQIPASWCILCERK